MAESTIQRNVTEHVMQLVRQNFGHELTKEQEQKYLAYFMRMLSGRIFTTITEDEYHLRTLIQKKLARLYPSKSLSSTKTLRFQAMADRLGSSRVLKNKWGILYVLYGISEQGAIVTGTSVIQDSFNSKMLSRIQPIGVETSKVPKYELERALKERPSSFPAKKISIFGNVSEEDILRDLLFVFQGIDGKYISYSILDDSYSISSSVSISESVRGIIMQLCEVGWLYKKVADYIQKHADNNYSGQVVQSFCFAIQGELNEYFRLLAMLEQQLLETTTKLDLMKLYLWMQEPLERMKWLAITCEVGQNLKGGVLASTIQQYTYIGSPPLYKFLSRILQEVCAPLISMIKLWMIHGEANDLYGDFFVQINPSISDEKLWYDKYSFIIELIPTFLTKELAQEVFLTGKAINFIRKCCAESEWTIDSALHTPEIKNWAEIMENSNILGEWISKAYDATNSRLLNILLMKYKLLDHCESIRLYMLMGQGDFLHYLMDLIHETLAKPAEQIYKHNLVAIVETAIRGSNAQYHKQEYLQCLDVKLLESSTGDDGWKIFSLDYKVGSPLNTILTPGAMSDYLRIFNFLWRLKRIYYVLSATWTQQMENKRALSSLREIQGDFQKANLLRHEMLLFISNFTNYIMVEVIETNWKNFLDSIRKAKNLDEIIQIHHRMVTTMLEKLLLTSKNSGIYKQLNGQQQSQKWYQDLFQKHLFFLTQYSKER